jgi:DNA-binding beta-propeller fold protein YncE
VEWANTGGQPSDLAFEPKTGKLYVADLAHAAIILVKDGGAMQLVVKEYEGVPFKVWRCGVVVGV